MQPYSGKASDFFFEGLCSAKLNSQDSQHCTQWVYDILNEVLASRIARQASVDVVQFSGFTRGDFLVFGVLWLTRHLAFGANRLVASVCRAAKVFQQL
jgi:hypothetical protein